MFRPGLRVFSHAMFTFRLYERSALPVAVNNRCYDALEFTHCVLFLGLGFAKASVVVVEACCEFVCVEARDFQVDFAFS